MKCRILQTQAHFHLLQEYIERGISIYFCKIFYKPGRLVLLTFLLCWSKCCLPGVNETKLISHTVTYIFTIMSCATALHNYSNFWRFVCRSLKVVLMLGKKSIFLSENRHIARRIRRVTFIFQYMAFIMS